MEICIFGSDAYDAETGTMVKRYQSPAVRSHAKARSNKRKKNTFNLRSIAFGFIAVALVFAAAVVSYITSLIFKNEKVLVPIVESRTFSEGILDDRSDPDDDAADGALSGQEQSKPVQAYWGTGRVRVYVDPLFPIIREEQKDPDVENILVFGVDSRYAGQKASRSDSMMIVTLDRSSQTLKFTSILRDTKVKIPGRTEPAKLNAAYVFGGVGLLINTINENFDLDIQKFAMVDMWSAEKIIDAMGGISLTVRSDEVSYVNDGVRETNTIFSRNSEPSPFLEKGGLQLLNGRQAVAYGRIRKIGSDLGRTSRQRRILTELAKQFKAASLSAKMATLDELSQSFESNIDKTDMISMAIDVFASIGKITQYRVPADGMYTTNTANWQISIDFSLQIPALHEFLWGADSGEIISLPEEASGPDSSLTGSDPSPPADSGPEISPDPSETSSGAGSFASSEEGSSPGEGSSASSSGLSSDPGASSAAEGGNSAPGSSGP